MKLDCNAMSLPYQLFLLATSKNTALIINGSISSHGKLTAKLELVFINAKVLFVDSSFNIWFQWKLEKKLLFSKGWQVFQRCVDHQDPVIILLILMRIEWNYSIKKWMCECVHACVLLQECSDMHVRKRGEEMLHCFLFK